MITGRGAWTTRGMPANANVYYQYVQPVEVGSQANLDMDHQAVYYGVKQIQTRINELFPAAHLPVTGVIDKVTGDSIKWTQAVLGIAADGEAGPTTALHMFWPYIKSMPYSADVNHIVGGICKHESGYDPGAVGFLTPDDIGLVQINGAANPNLSVSQRFDYHVAFKYAADRIQSAITTPGYTKDAAIASYGYPAVAHYWATSGTETYPADPALNDIVLAYVAYIKNWNPGF